jgi:hypothetical protein
MVADHQGGGHQGGVTTDYSITVVQRMRFGVGPGTYDHRHLTQLIFTMHGVAWCSGIGDVAECNTNWFCQQAGGMKIRFCSVHQPYLH